MSHTKDDLKKLESEETRRGMLSHASTWAMRLGLAGGYGAFALIAARFLYPARGQRRAWMYVTEADNMEEGDSMLFRGPGDETINIARQKRAGGEGDFIALSSTCPHLGCQVHWEGHNDRFFCPCHNGTFDASGIGTGGPPGDAGMSLPRYPLRLDGGLLYIELPVESLSADNRLEPIEVDGIRGAGHDPCLAKLQCSQDVEQT